MNRRRRWPEDEKLKIVLEALEAPRQVSATARRYGGLAIIASQVAAIIPNRAE
jgi:transposase-like protein